MYRILHVFTDDKFFDRTASFFDAVPGIVNTYCFYTSDKEYRFKYIKNTDKVTLVTDLKEYYKILKDKDNDIVYFHSLPPTFYRYVLQIPRQTKVIWWAWGFDIYYSYRYCPPLVPLELYKPLTRKAVRKHLDLVGILKHIFYGFSYLHDMHVRRKAISRIDYFTPVLPIEYDEILRSCRFFHAEPFMIRSGPGTYDLSTFNVCTEPRNILIGNSLTLTNNHLDIFATIAGCRLHENQKYIIPVSYGTDIDKTVIKDAFRRDDVIWLDDFIPYAEYIKIHESITHAVFGVIRQQAMGNVFQCLKQGVKVFLYSESLVYRQLKSMGFTVYTIEDISEDSFITPLDPQYAKENYRIFCENYADNVEYAYEEIMRIMSDRND